MSDIICDFQKGGFSAMMGTEAGLEFVKYAINCQKVV